MDPGAVDHPGGYRGALEDFYEQAAARLASWATAGGAVARSRQRARLGTGGTATERVS